MRLLLFVVGVGAGNTTRTLALLGALKRLEPGLDIHIAAQGRARELLEASYPVHPMAEITYASGGEFTIWNILKSNLSFPARFMANRRAADELLGRLRPDLAVADSDFYCLGPARRRGIPLASINNSALIVAHLRKFGIPPGCGFSARFIEGTDAWLQERYPSRVVCPVLKPMEGLPSKYIQIPPIVRPGFEPGGAESKGDEESKGSECGEEVVAVTGGSGIGAQELDLQCVRAPLTTYGTRLAKIPPQARQLGFTLDDAGPMRRARVLVVQGGFSSVSEAVALRRPVVVVPIARHAEQHVNAAIVESLGIGLAARGADAGAKVCEILSRYDEFAERCRKCAIPSDGAEQAARALLDMMRSGPQT